MQSIGKKPLTVSQLIDALSQYPSDMPVLVEGCDCLGDASGVSIHMDRIFQKRECVLIERHR